MVIIYSVFVISLAVFLFVNYIYTQKSPEIKKLEFLQKKTSELVKEMELRYQNPIDSGGQIPDPEFDKCLKKINLSCRKIKERIESEKYN